MSNSLTYYSYWVDIQQIFTVWNLSSCIDLTLFFFLSFRIVRSSFVSSDFTEVILVYFIWNCFLLSSIFFPIKYYYFSQLSSLLILLIFICTWFIVSWLYVRRSVYLYFPFYPFIFLLWASGFVKWRLLPILWSVFYSFFMLWICCDIWLLSIVYKYLVNWLLILYIRNLSYPIKVLSVIPWNILSK